MARGVRRYTSLKGNYIAAIDQGTSSTRVILYDAKTAAPVANGSHQVQCTSWWWGDEE